MQRVVRSLLATRRSTPFATLGRVPWGLSLRPLCPPGPRAFPLALAPARAELRPGVHVRPAPPRSLERRPFMSLLLIIIILLILFGGGGGYYGYRSYGGRGLGGVLGLLIIIILVLWLLGVFATGVPVR